jgi:predicted thioesterase
MIYKEVDKMEIKVGIKAVIEDKVAEQNTALAVGSGSLSVFATPAMIALMEKASCKAVAECLPEGSTTVGTMVNIEHLSATPLGGTVTVTAEVTAIEGRKICFNVTATDNAGLIGKGTHDRFIVQAERFMEKTNSKI